MDRNYVEVNIPGSTKGSGFDLLPVQEAHDEMDHSLGDHLGLQNLAFDQPPHGSRMNTETMVCVFLRPEHTFDH